MNTANPGILFLGTVLFAFIVVSGCSYQPGTPIKLKRITTTRDTLIIRKELFEHPSPDENCAIYQAYPQITFASRPRIAQQANKLICDDFRITEYKHTPKNELCANAQSIAGYSIYNYRNTVLSLMLQDEFFGSGAGHGYITTRALNIDLLTGKSIEQSQLFISKRFPELKSILLKQFQQLADSLCKDGIVPDVTDKDVPAPIAVISAKGFTFYLHITTGNLEFELLMPYAELKPYLNNHYLFYN
ncbi:MAG: hypothetical protein V4592_05165 [Bacteroidota bacterium]